MTSTPPARTGRAHRAPAGEGDRLRTELLDAAEAEIIAKGTATQVSLRAVARAVGVSPTSVYLHFADKDDLLLAVCHRRFTEFAGLFRQARADHDTPTEQLRACGTAYVRFGLEHPEAFQLLFGTLPMEVILERLPPEELVGQQALGEIAGIVADGIRAGEFRAVDPEQTSLSLWAMVHGLVGVITHGSEKPIDADRLTEHSLALLMEGLQA